MIDGDSAPQQYTAKAATPESSRKPHNAQFGL